VCLIAAKFENVDRTINALSTFMSIKMFLFEKVGRNVCLVSVISEILLWNVIEKTVYLEKQARLVRIGGGCLFWSLVRWRTSLLFVRRALRLRLLRVTLPTGSAKDSVSSPILGAK
jgi:hypothetical protein